MPPWPVRRAKTAAKRLIAATPYRSHLLLPTMVPLAAGAARGLDRVRRARAKPRSLEELASTIPPSDMEHHVPCPSCGATRIRVRYHPRFPEGEYRVGQCEGCDLLQRVPAIRPERVPDLYASDDYADFLDGDYGRERQAKYRSNLDRFSPELDDGTGRTLLDFGCGTGAFMDVAAERGFDVYGVDLSPAARARAAERLGASRIGSDPGHMDPSVPQQFDVITMWSVLAHIADPDEQISDLARRLKPGGRLLIYTVNASSLQRHAFGSRWNGFTRNHLIFWDQTNLTRLLLRSGFSSVDFRHMYGLDRDTKDLPERAVARHFRAIERWDGANMLGVLATR